MRNRGAFRRRNRLTVRNPNRSSGRQRWRSPDDLAAALGCFRRAIRAHRRMAKLAPHEFDAAVVERDRREREERRAWRASWEPALEKVYGPPSPAERERQLRAEWLAAQPPALHPRTRQAAKREFANWQFWMEAGRLATARHQQRRPHAIPSLTRLVCLLEIGMDLGSLATGRDWRRPEPAAPSEPARTDWEAELRRAYGSRQCEPSGNPQPSTCKQQQRPPEPLASEPTTTSSPAKPAPPVDVPSVEGRLQPATRNDQQSAAAGWRPRRDGWQSWARQQRRSMQ